MDGFIDESSSKLARRIRLERDARRWSLAELAERSGVSKAAISKIERGEVSPTAVILVRLAAAFDLTLAGLLLRAEGDAGRLSRAAEQPTWQDPESGYMRQQVYSRPDHPLELVSVVLPAGARVEFPASSYARTRHVVWVTKGRLTIEESGERHELEAGDSLGFGPPSPVAYVNESAAATAYVVVLARG